jgi:hypothetical protein
MQSWTKSPATLQGISLWSEVTCRLNGAALRNFPLNLTDEIMCSSAIRSCWRISPALRCSGVGIWLVVVISIVFYWLRIFAIGAGYRRYSRNSLGLIGGDRR